MEAPRTRVPSLDRVSTASSVLRTPPSSPAAPDASRPAWAADPSCGGLPVLRLCPSRHAVANTPAEGAGLVALLSSISRARRPSPLSGRVGLRVNSFGACSAFTRVTACRFAESLSLPLSPRLRRLRCLHRRWDSYPAGATTFAGAGLSPAGPRHLFTAHPITSSLFRINFIQLPRVSPPRPGRAPDGISGTPWAVLRRRRLPLPRPDKCPAGPVALAADANQLSLQLLHAAAPGGLPIFSTARKSAHKTHPNTP